jgi:hypothetical protein
MHRCFFILLAFTASASVDLSHGPLRVSDNRRYLQHADGTPFFWLGDTAWELFHRLNREAADRYLEDRRKKGFTVIQAVVLAELDGLTKPNAYGDIPLADADPGRPVESYFRHVDTVVRLAEKKGLYIGMLPSWGNKVRQARWEKKNEVIFTAKNAREYGRYIGKRYKDAINLIWILGGDRDPAGVEDVWRAMAEGIRETDMGKHLMTYHPQGGQSSSARLHDEAWLDFNMMQSGHSARQKRNDHMIDADYARKPVKPVLDGEPRYENHPVNWKPDENGWFDDYDVRQAAYWALFAGAFGHTYGCHDIWQMRSQEREPVGLARGTWQSSLELPGAKQMTYVRRLMQSRPMLARLPDQSILSRAQWPDESAPRATRGDDYAFIYVPAGEPLEIVLGKIKGAGINAWWFDPRTGNAEKIGTFANKGKRRFTPPGDPGRGNDWVLVLDDEKAGYPAPGTGVRSK